MNKDEIETDIVKIEDFLKRSEDFAAQTQKVLAPIVRFRSSLFSSDTFISRCLSGQQRALSHSQRCILPD